MFWLKKSRSKIIYHGFVPKFSALSSKIASFHKSIVEFSLDSIWPIGE